MIGYGELAVLLEQTKDDPRVLLAEFGIDHEAPVQVAMDLVRSRPRVTHDPVELMTMFIMGFQIGLLAAGLRLGAGSSESSDKPKEQRDGV